MFVVPGPASQVALIKRVYASPGLQCVLSLHGSSWASIAPECTSMAPGMSLHDASVSLYGSKVTQVGSPGWALTATGCLDGFRVRLYGSRGSFHSSRVSFHSSRVILLPRLLPKFSLSWNDDKSKNRIFSPEKHYRLKPFFRKTKRNEFHYQP